MESHRQKRPAADPDHDTAWRVVRRWPGIRAEPKLAWWYLWRMSGQGGQQCVVKAVDLGADQGTSDDAGARYLATLERESLVSVEPLAAGRKLVTLFDPLERAKARRACGGDSQLAFGFVDEFIDELEAEGTEYPPAEVVGHVPTAVPAIGLASEPRWDADGGSRFGRPEHSAEPRPTAVPPSEPRSHSALPPAEPPAEPRTTIPLHVEVRERIASRARATLTKTDKDKEAQAHETKTTDSARSNQPNDLAHRTSTRGTAVASEPARIGIAAAAVAAAIGGPHAYHEAVANCQALIAAAVRDPGAADVVHALAWANAEQRVPDREIARMIARMRSGTDAEGVPFTNRGGFFRRMVQRKFRDLGIAPEDYFSSKP